MLNHIQKEIKFEYEMHLVGDGKFGDIDPDTGEWNGMIQEVIERVNIFVFAPRHVIIIISFNLFTVFFFTDIHGPAPLKIDLNLLATI